MTNATTASLTPRKYLKLLREKPDSIQAVTIAPPKLGRKGFGFLEVTKKKPAKKPLYALDLLVLGAGQHGRTKPFGRVARAKSKTKKADR
ncbi:MAG: hypothetical protein ABI977_22035 [Acidobacteriota bacterium]